MSAKTEWTPYGLEAIRIRYLRRRRLFAILFALGLIGTWFLLIQSTPTRTQEIFVNGKRANTISFEDDRTPKKDGPVTVAIEPGRVTRADTNPEAGADDGTPGTRLPVFERASPIPYKAYVLLYGPFLLIALAAWLLAKRRGKHDQVNYGIYKGAMPFEMISASQSNRIFTARWARTSLFGRRREDHVPREVRIVERVDQEDAS